MGPKRMPVLSAMETRGQGWNEELVKILALREKLPIAQDLTNLAYVRKRSHTNRPGRISHVQIDEHPPG